MNADQWHSETVLITVRAAPTPSKKYIETSCVAGVRLSDSKPIRIYPVPARQLSEPQVFRKYSIIQARFRKAGDHRNESFNIDMDSLHVLDRVDTGPGHPPTWQKRDSLVQGFRVAKSVEQLRELQTEMGLSKAPSLALIRPRQIMAFKIQETGQTTWDPVQLVKLGQMGMFDESTRAPLEYVPYRFSYTFECDDIRCTGHDLGVLDWEVSESYRQWRRTYHGESAWREAMQAKYWAELAQTRDLQFYVGTISSHPQNWTIIGLYYPPRLSKMLSLNL